MLFSRRAKVNGPAFLVGWVLALAAVSTAVYVVSHDGSVATSSTAADSVSWGKIVLGVVLLLLARRNWSKRPVPGEEPALPKWMAAVDVALPGQGLRTRHSARRGEPQEPDPHRGSRRGTGATRPLDADAVVATAVFVVIASLTIALPVLYALVGGERAQGTLDSAKAWLSVHNAAVMAVLFLVFGVDLIAKGLPPLTS